MNWTHMLHSFRVYMWTVSRPVISRSFSHVIVRKFFLHNFPPPLHSLSQSGGVVENDRSCVGRSLAQSNRSLPPAGAEKKFQPSTFYGVFHERRTRALLPCSFFLGPTDGRMDDRVQCPLSCECHLDR